MGLTLCISFLPKVTPCSAENVTIESDIVHVVLAKFRKPKVLFSATKMRTRFDRFLTDVILMFVFTTLPYSTIFTTFR